MGTNNKAALALACFAVAFLAYWGFAQALGKADTPGSAYFNLLADAFLHGRLHLVNPPTTIDLALFNGRWYVPFPPLPALLMLPWVAAAGVGAVNTVVFNAAFAAANVALVFLILSALSQRKFTALNTADTLWLTLLFGLGSVHWYMATQGSVWFMAQICTVTFVALAVLITLQRGPAWLAGLALGLAVAARPNVALSFPLLLGIVAMADMSPIDWRGLDWRRQLSWRRILRWGAQAAVPILLVAAALLAYNQARFHNPLDFGYANAEVNPRLAADLAEHGQFSPHYIPRNLRSMLFALPVWDAETRRPTVDGDGLSLLITTPALVYLVWARKRNPLTLGAWTALGLLLIPLLLYYNTGWWQFGYRFSLDFMIPVMVLLATALSSPLPRTTRLLILAGVAVNLYGVLWWHLL